MSTPSKFSYLYTPHINSVLEFSNLLSDHTAKCFEWPFPIHHFILVSSASPWAYIVTGENCFISTQLSLLSCALFWFLLFRPWQWTTKFEQCQTWSFNLELFEFAKTFCLMRSGPGLFFFQFCEVSELGNIHKRGMSQIWPEVKPEVKPAK